MPHHTLHSRVTIDFKQLHSREHWNVNIVYSVTAASKSACGDDSVSIPVLVDGFCFAVAAVWDSRHAVRAGIVMLLVTVAVVRASNGTVTYLFEL
jgi:hypothetical protein